MSSHQKGEKEKVKWLEVLNHAKVGNFEDIDPRVQITQARNLEFIFNRAVSKRPLETLPHTTRHLWLWGASGTGKSLAARTRYPKAYLKMCNKWWDAYSNEDVVLIEDFDALAHKVLVHHIKIWADIYPFLTEVKGGARKIRPKLLIITSNYHPNEIWFTSSELEPILRRFTTLHFENGNVHESFDWPSFEDVENVSPISIPSPLPPISSHHPIAPQWLGLDDLDDFNGLDIATQSTYVVSPGSPGDLFYEDNENSLSSYNSQF